LLDQFLNSVVDLAWLTLVLYALRKAFAQTQSLIHRFEAHRSTIVTAMRLVELRLHALVKQPVEQNNLSRAIVSHAKALLIGISLVS
jgi:hypothetical protein